MSCLGLAYAAIIAATAHQHGATTATAAERYFAANSTTWPLLYYERDAITLDVRSMWPFGVWALSKNLTPAQTGRLAYLMCINPEPVKHHA